MALRDLRLVLLVLSLIVERKDEIGFWRGGGLRCYNIKFLPFSWITNGGGWRDVDPWALNVVTTEGEAGSAGCGATAKSSSGAEAWRALVAGSAASSVIGCSDCCCCCTTVGAARPARTITAALRSYGAARKTYDPSSDPEELHGAGIDDPHARVGSQLCLGQYL